MTDFNYGDIIEYIDETYDENFNAARNWAFEHNTTFEELIDRRKEGEKDEKYIDTEEKEVIVPARTYDQQVPAEYDEEGNLIREAGTITIEEPEHKETVIEEVEKTRKVKILYRYFQIGNEHVVTKEEQQMKRSEAYAKEKDPITCQIMSLRDEEQTPEIIAEIDELLKKRSDVVKDIKERYPYPEE